MQLTPNQLEALRLLKTYGGGHIRFWSLAGNAKATSRVHVLSTLLGKKVPRAKAGVNAMRDTFYTLYCVGNCEAVREENFAKWAEEELQLAQAPAPKKPKLQQCIIISFNDGTVMSVKKVREGETPEQTFERWLKETPEMDGCEADDTDYYYEVEVLED